MRFFHNVLQTILASTSFQDVQDAGLTVQTQQGVVVGTQILPTVRQFLGIPYAAAERWQIPQLPPNRSEVFQASKFSDSCFQMLSPGRASYLTLNGNGGMDVPMSEDCLGINIWSPSIDRKHSTAVLIWIHGGGYTFGTAGVPVYNGTNLVRDNDDITLVTFNYRLNIFGQPNAPQLSAKSENLNFGLLDIEAAIHWVHANIANFGGDPDRITIFGQSAGGSAVETYTFTHPHDTIVKGVIAQSGGSSGVKELLVTPPGDHENWKTIASMVGCGDVPTPEQFVCMQRTPAHILEHAIVSNITEFYIVLDNKTMYADIDSRAAKGSFLRVPYMVGSTANEADIYEVGKQLIGNGFAVPVLTELLSDSISVYAASCKPGITAKHRRDANVPTFRYQYQGVFRSLSTRPDLRAYHSSEIPMIFGTYNGTVINGVSFPASADQITLSIYMQSAWVAFARDPSHGLPDLGWPLYDPNTETLAQLGNFFNTSGVVFGKSTVLDAACSHQDVLEAIVDKVGPLLR